MIRRLCASLLCERAAHRAQWPRLRHLPPRGCRFARRDGHRRLGRAPLPARMGRGRRVLLWHFGPPQPGRRPGDPTHARVRQPIRPRPHEHRRLGVDDAGRHSTDRRRVPRPARVGAPAAAARRSGSTRTTCATCSSGTATPIISAAPRTFSSAALASHCRRPTGASSRTAAGPGRSPRAPRLRQGCRRRGATSSSPTANRYASAASRSRPC